MISRRLVEDSLAADILFVNDGSKDNTQGEIDEAMAKYPNVVGIAHAQNKGYGEALKTGFSYAVSHNYSFVFVMDADLTMDPKYIKDFFKRIIHEHYDFVIGSRYTRGGAMRGVPLYRQIISRTASLVSHTCFRLPIRDYTLGFRAIRTSLLEKMQLTEKGFPILIEQVYQALQHTRKFSDVPITLTNREVGQSTFQFTPDVFLKYLKYALKAAVVMR